MALYSSGDHALVAGKRKRPAINYATLGQEHIDDLDIEGHSEEGATLDSDSDSDEDGLPEDDSVYGSRKKPTKAKRTPKKRARWTTPKAKKDQKPFPFLALPPELRDYIYELSLVDPNGIKLCAQTKAARRTITRVTNYDPNSQCGLYITPSNVPARATLTPNLLATNKQIRAEALGYLYKQPFIVQDTMALHTFIATIAPQNRLQLASITLKSWGRGRGIYKAMNFASLTLLAACTNLKELVFDCDVVWTNEPKRLASNLYRNGHFLFEAYGAVHGREAAVEVVKFGPKALGGSGYWPGANSQKVEERREKFEEGVREEMRRLLEC